MNDVDDKKEKALKELLRSVTRICDFAKPMDESCRRFVLDAEDFNDLGLALHKYLEEK